MLDIPPCVKEDTLHEGTALWIKVRREYAELRRECTATQSHGRLTDWFTIRYISGKYHFSGNSVTQVDMHPDVLSIKNWIHGVRPSCKHNVGI